MEHSVEQVREIAKIGFEPKKPFESVPINKKVREIVETFKSDTLKLKAVRKAKRNKFLPVNRSWVKISENGSSVKSTGCRDRQS